MENFLSLHQIFNLAFNLNASDIHISTNKEPSLRVNGDIKNTDFQKLSNENIREILSTIMTENQKKEFEENKEIDFGFSWEDKARFRANVFYCEDGIGGSFRIIPKNILSIKELNFPKIFYDIVKKERGLVLVTGPTGSGKSTTLASFINQINQDKAKHILTIEDPIEFVYESKKSIITQREVGEHTKSFSKALKSSLRQDPDCILVGEMRDIETISLALTLAETGHLVFATLHTQSAATSIDRIIDVFPAERQFQIRSMLAGTLEAVISQTLCKKIENGRIPAFEIMIVNSAIRNLIREGKSHQIQNIMQTSKDIGMITMDMYLKNLFLEGKISKEEAQEKCFNKENLFT